MEPGIQLVEGRTVHVRITYGVHAPDGLAYWGAGDSVGFRQCAFARKSVRDFDYARARRTVRASANSLFPTENQQGHYGHVTTTTPPPGKNNC
jgi:hypothetical protein